MAKIMQIKKVFQRLEKQKLWLDNLTFGRIFLIWLGVVLIFGFVYLFFATDDSYLVHSYEQIEVDKLADTIYFSFITATTTGFGDISPLGYFKVISIFEVILGLMLLALVTSRLVSIKQDLLLREIYDISFNERINRLRSSLLLFRQNLTRFIRRVEDGRAKKKSIEESYTMIIPFREVLREIPSIIPGKDCTYATIDATDLEILFNSIVLSLDKITEYLDAIKKHHNDKIENVVAACLAQSQKILNNHAELIIEENRYELLDSFEKVTKDIEAHVQKL